MPLPKPTVLPEWAMDDIPNGVDGQYNVVEPPTEKKLTGWNFIEKPNRQYWNWFQRQCSLWIAYFNENLDFTVDTLIPVWEGLTNQPNPNHFYYSKQGDKVFFNCNMTWGTNSNFTDALVMTNLPYTAKNISGFPQSVHVSRGAGPTMEGLTYADAKILSAFVDPGTTRMRIRYEKPSDGLGGDVIASVSGQLVISGFYFIENV